MNRHSLVIRLTALSTLLIVLTVIILSSVVYYGFHNKIKHQVQRNLSEQAEFQVNKVKQLLQTEQTNLLAWRTSSEMLDIVVDDLDKRIQSELINLKANYQLPGELYVFNQQDLLIASSQQGALGQSLPIEWQNGLHDVDFIAPHTVAFLDRTQAITAFVLHIKIPGMEKMGTLVLTHPWQAIWQQLVFDDYQFAFYHEALQRLDLVTESGIVYYPVDTDFKQQERWIFNQQAYLGALSNTYQIGQLNFQVAAFISEQEANKPQLEVLKELNIAACIVILPIIFLAIALSHRFIAPIKKLTDTIKCIEASNDLSLTVAVNSKDEVADLARAFNRMIDHLAKAFTEREKIAIELEDLNQNLEQKVHERTQELANALDQLKSAQIQLVQSEKMTSLGQLVAGIAHEINNPIGAIYANVSPLKEYVSDLQEAVDKAQSLLPEQELASFSLFLDEIDYDFLQEDLVNLLTSQQQAAERIKKIVLSLRNFSRLDQGELKQVYLEEGIDSTLQLLHHEYKLHITIEKDYQLNQLVECYASELNQVFMNILANAIQAIADKGVIRIHTYLNDAQAVVEISDNGCGIPDNLKSRIFEPFFTTKEIGKGTGLGLSISYGIIQKHEGSLSIDAAPNQGTRFIIRIPLLLTKN